MKKFLTWLCLGVLLFAGVYACLDMAVMPRTYEGQNAAVSVYQLQQDPASYDDSAADGAAAAIVQQNLEIQMTRLNLFNLKRVGVSLH